MWVWRGKGSERGRKEGRKGVRKQWGKEGLTGGRKRRVAEGRSGGGREIGEKWREIWRADFTKCHFANGF